jgi:hypothetical protein
MRKAVVSRVLVGGLTPLLFLACGTTPPPQAPPTPAPSGSGAMAPMPPKVDLSPVEQPKGVAGLFRVKSPKATLDVLQKVLRLPTPLEELFEKEMGDPDVAKILKLDAAIDGAVQLDPAAEEMKPDVFAAFSIPLRDFQEARRIAETRGRVQDHGPGMFTFKPKHSRKGACVVAQSTGDAPARLICGARDRDLDALVPWMTRGLPSQSFGNADLHAEFRMKPVQEKFRGIFENKSMIGSLVSTAVARFSPVQDPAFSDLIGDVATEGVAFAADIETVSVDGVLDAGGNGATLTATTKYAKTDSWLTQVMTQHNAKMAPAPAIFWSAPKGADAVTYGLGSDPKFVEPIKKRLASLVSSMTKAKLGDADRKALEDVMLSMPSANVPAVSVQGHIVADPKAKPKAKGGDDERPPMFGMAHTSPQERVDAALGWRLTGVESDAKVWSKWFTDLAAVYNRAGVQKALKEIDPKAAKLLTVKKVGSAGYPAGSTVVDLTVNVGEFMRPHFDESPVMQAVPPGGKSGKAPPRRPPPPKKEQEKPITLHVVVVPDGGRAWIGVSANGDALKTPLKAALSSAPKEGQIGSRTDLDLFKTTPLVAGGFLAPRGIMDAALRKAPNPEMVQAVIKGLPNKGETPMLLLMSGTAGPAPTSTMEFRLQKGTMDDFASLAALASMGMKRSSAPPPSEVAH